MPPIVPSVPSVMHPEITVSAETPRYAPLLTWRTVIILSTCATDGIAQKSTIKYKKASVGCRRDLPSIIIIHQHLWPPSSSSGVGSTAPITIYQAYSSSTSLSPSQSSSVGSSDSESRKSSICHWCSTGFWLSNRMSTLLHRP